ncbi:IclR family transcriptional regulator [Prauserella alba]|uniref:IclR family transcriptional regulator n=1 Tax=Prauserella alba TaxID=176898 RepID=A0ABP4FUS1_9PSEU|nr:IclR family transcriptional regulator [Prauserella alba]MCP2181789.1 transcriptional regulator, IclR family [Prauserella alba]
MVNDFMDAGERAGSDGRGMSVLLNGIAVLGAFSSEEPQLGVTEIAAKVGLHKSTVSRILATLEQTGMVERDELSRRFRLGLGVLALAGPLLGDLDVRRAAYPVLSDLSIRTGETAALMVWNEPESVCVEEVSSRRQVKHTTPLGTRYNTAASSSVQVFCAAVDENRVRGLLEQGSLRAAGTDEWAVERYLTRLGEVRELGYAVNYGETSAEEVGIAAAVHDHRGKQSAAVLLSAPRFRVSRQQLDAYGEMVREAAATITARLGGA